MKFRINQSNKTTINYKYLFIIKSPDKVFYNIGAHYYVSVVNTFGMSLKRFKIKKHIRCVTIGNRALCKY